VAARKPHVEFFAKIVRIVPLYAIDLPAAASRALGKRGAVPVVGTIDGTPFHTTLVPVKGGRHRFWVNAEMRKASGTTLGDRVAVTLRVDEEPPTWHTPPDLADALHDEGVLEAFEAMSPGRRGQFLKWLERAVHEDTRARRIARCVELALAEREKRLDREARAAAKRALPRPAKT
jgi:uncharacterized protein DUF1905/bacteriocin resistance YdeI/OmpD-like protein